MNANLSTTYTGSDVVESTNTMSRKVIVNVDDLGLSEPINNAATQLARKRLITASSYLVAGNISDACIQELKLFNVDIGLHLDFTRLFETTLPKTLPKLLKTSYLRKLEAKTVTDEIKQQLDMFEDTFNHAPRFIDGHQHVHQFAIIRQCLIDEMLKRYGKRRPSSSHQPHNKWCHIATRVTTPINYDIKAWAVYTLGGYQLKKLCERSGIVTNSHFGGVYDFNATPKRLNNLWDGWLDNCPLGFGGFDEKNRESPVSVIICHPAMPDNHWQDDIKKAREQEYQWMMSGDLKALYSKHFVELTHWRNIYPR